MKKYSTILYSGVWILLILLLGISMGFVNNTRNSEKCSALFIDVDSENGNYFVDSDEVRDFVYEQIGDPIGVSISTIDFEKLEKSIGKMDAVRNAEVYANLKGELSIEIEQRTPIARVYFSDGSSSYIDDLGLKMPLSSKYTARVIVINGMVLNPDQSENPTEQWNDLLTVIQKFQSDEFFKAQFEQIYISKNGEYELSPRVGRHTIILGKVDDLNKKLKKLKLFYKEGISKVDWNKYKKIDLRFKDQIVCAKR